MTQPDHKTPGAAVQAAIQRLLWLSVTDEVARDIAQAAIEASDADRPSYTAVCEHNVQLIADKLHRFGV